MPLPFRQIHLDFHTSPAIGDVGSRFDPRKFAATLKRAHVDSVTVFAKCHHGHLYYNTRRPERHPGLKKNLDLLGRQVDALHSQGIRAPIYVSVQLDEFAAERHTDWIARQADTKLAKAGGAFDAAWHVMDMSSPYQDYLAEQLAEILKVFKPVDGIFFDMCWNQRSTTPWTIDAMRRCGLHPERDEDRYPYAAQMAMAYMRRFRQMVKASSPRATVYYNSRPMAELPGDIPLIDHVEIEALPTGGWGYAFFPRFVRLARTLGKPYLGMTSRFHKAWGDFGGVKPYAALEYETSQMIAHGARCSVGDQMHPRGLLDPSAYEVIGRVYQRVTEREPWLRRAKPVTQIALAHLVSGVPGAPESWTAAANGAVRMLTQLRQQFDILDPREQDFSRYSLLILPDFVTVDAKLAKRISAYLKRGGALLATGHSGLSPDGTQKCLPQLGVQPQGLSPFLTTYLRFDPSVNAATSGPATDHVMYERGIRVLPSRGAKVLARVVEPYFDRTWEHFCSHAQTPPAKLTRYAAAVLRGRVGYVSYPIFSAFANHGNYPYRQLVQALIDHLLPDPLLRVDGPTGLETSVMQQGRRTIVHLLYYTPERRTPTLDMVEDVIPLADLHLSLSLPKSPRRVQLVPQRRDLPFTYRSGRVEVTLPRLAGHQMIAFE
ncbi:MAG: alpha-L-fucosidase [Phycisphaeraceae bacterium]|nr:alpha-L-fucosidase [Phycisphaeraceae bacterium]